MPTVSIESKYSEAAKRNGREVEIRELIPPTKRIKALREYQVECQKAIDETGGGSHIIVMATGMGKTATFTTLNRTGKMLIIAAGQEIVLNSLCYFTCRIGVEMGDYRCKRDFPMAEVVAASVQSLCNRLGDYDPEEFEYIIVDEAHHAAASTYRKIIDYFRPKYRLGFTATPNRTDGVRLDDIFTDVLFERSFKWAIKHGYLCDILPRSVHVDIDLRGCRVKKGEYDTDFVAADLAKAMEKSAPIIADIYRTHAYGQTLIYVASVKLAHEVASLVPGAAVVVGGMKRAERAAILKHFEEGVISCIVSVSVLKEGVDLPNVETIVNARPTASSLLYTQMVGRGSRLYPGKKFLNLIEIEGLIDENVTLCTAPTLLGIDMRALPKIAKEAIDMQMLSAVEEIIEAVLDKPENWALSATSVRKWADVTGYDLHNVCWLILPDGAFECSLMDQQKGLNVKLRIPGPDTLGKVSVSFDEVNKKGVVCGQTTVRLPLQIALDKAREYLDAHFGNSKILWDTTFIEKYWGAAPATERQIQVIRRRMPDLAKESLTKQQASAIIQRLVGKASDAATQPVILPVEISKPMGAGRNAIVDFDPGPGYQVECKKRTLKQELTTWLRACVRASYRQHGCRLEKLVESLNGTTRLSISRNFIYGYGGGKYKYLELMDGAVMPRRHLMGWLAKEIDILIPRLIYSEVLHPDTELKPSQIKMDLTTDPLQTLRPEYPETADIVAGRRSGKIKLPKDAEAAKQKAMERWAVKQQQKKGPSL